MSRGIGITLVMCLALVVSGCGSAPKLDPRGNVTIYVANDSSQITPVDLTIEIDGTPVIRDDFESTTTVTPYFSTYTARVPWGRHTLSVRSFEGGASLTRSFVVTGRKWISVDYNYDTINANPPIPKHIDCLIRSKQILFL
jgi:hypothetical protein